MSVRTPRQLANRRRIEAAIRLAAPLLDLTLAVGDRASRLLVRAGTEPEPPRRRLPTGDPGSIGGSPRRA